MARRLLRSGAGRAALIAGTTVAATRSARRATQTTNSSTKDDVAASLKRLAELKASGALTDKEFKAAKAKLLF
jgi:Short C-terminal domain